MPKVAPIVAALLIAAPVFAQNRAPIDGSPEPIPPAVITRDATGRATVRAIKLSQPLKVDGVLDEDVYTKEQPFGGLIQVAPNYGAVSTEKSDIWITYDDKNIYLSCRCYDSSPPGKWVVNELRRDTNGLRNNEHIGVLFDTYYDRRSGFAFYTNPLGARADYSVIDEGGSNTDWNPVWSVKTGRFDGGWTVEMAIPFKSLRYHAGKNQIWGIQIRRSIRHKNEWTYLTPVPRILAGPQALNRVSAGGTLVGLDLPESGKNLELKPYAISRSTTDRLSVPALDNHVTAAVGGDAKYAITPNLTADATVNTDFAQVEVDEQQVNLTRFNLFYPEKRDFFLEGRGIFDFARGGQGVTASTDQSNTPYLFYTRRIGLDNSRVIPINEGGRLTGKVGPWAIGLLDIQTGRDATSQSLPTNYSILRLKRDILGHSAIGIMATDRTVGASGTGSNAAYGADATFSLSQSLLVSTYWARTITTNKNGDDQSYQGFVDYGDDLYGAHAEYLSVGANFDPQIGFIRRSDFNRSFGLLRFSPRPTKYIPSVRKFTFTGSDEYVVNGAGSVDGHTYVGSFNTEFQSSDQLTFTATRDFEFLRQPFTPSGSPSAIPVGGYLFNNASVSYAWGAQRLISGALTVQVGHYYDGTIKSISFGAGSGGFSTQRVVIGRVALEPTIQYTEIDRPDASFTTRIFRTRADYAFSPLMFLSALLQYSSADRAFSTDLRYRWEYAPGSELFLVYTDEHDVTSDALATPTTVRGLKNRAFVVKINRLFRY